MSTPLAPTRLVRKRDASAELRSPVKRAKPVPVVVVAPLTPHASSDDAHAGAGVSAAFALSRLAGASTPAFKRPAVPAPVWRALTPSTSTVAHSSSPRPSSPLARDAYVTASSSSTTAAVQLVHGETLVFGRHRSSSSVAPTTTVVQAVPPHLHYLISLAHDARVVSLPRTAAHASRVHAAVELVPAAAASASAFCSTMAAQAASAAGVHVVRVLVIGQNGARVRCGKRRVRMASGMRIDFDGDVEIDFYGAKVAVARPAAATSFPPSSASSPTPMPVPALRDSSPMPPSSPPLPAVDEHDEDMPDAAAAPPSSPPLFDMRVLSSPLSEPEEGAKLGSSSVVASDDEPVDGFELEAPSSPADGFEFEAPSSPAYDTGAAELASVHVKREALEAAAPARLHVERPADVDLAALLASTVVFSGSSKLSLPDLVRSLLEPSLRSHADEEQWSVWISDELETNPMFGKVERHGKDELTSQDASGRPLLAHFFYAPDADPDRSRAKELGGLVRPLRAAQRTAKAIDWRPVGMGRRRY